MLLQWAKYRGLMVVWLRLMVRVGTEQVFHSVPREVAFKRRSFNSSYDFYLVYTGDVLMYISICDISISSVLVSYTVK